jgi:hypothetical protein
MVLLHENGPKQREGSDMHQEEPEPRAKTLILFGVGLLMVVISIIVVAALLGA